MKKDTQTTTTTADTSEPCRRTLPWLTLFVVLGVFQGSLHLFFVLSSRDPRILVPTSVSWLHDLLILSVYCMAASTATQWLPRAVQRPTAAIGAAGLLVLAGLLAFYPSTLRQLLVFPVNLFESDLTAGKQVILEYLGLAAMIPVLMAMVLTAAAMMFKKRLSLPRTVRVTGLLGIILLSMLFLRRPSPQPLLYSLQTQIQNWFSPAERAVASLDIMTKTNSGSIEPLQYPNTACQDYQHVLMIVLEGVTADAFEAEFMTRPNGFYQRHQPNAIYYANYYTTNLDSYTSLITMITGIQVPYRCYTDNSLYERVNEEANLVDFFNRQGHESIFVSTFEHHPYIACRSFWNRIVLRKDFEQSETFTSVGFSRMEKATEDKLALDYIVRSMQQYEKTFILHELAYGHSSEWQVACGKTQLQYCNEYLCELTEIIQAAGLEQDTLFIIVSDHGLRDRSADVKNYRIPLLMTGKTLGAKTNTDFLSHLELPAIVFEMLGNNSSPKRPERIFCIGSSEKWVYGCIDQDQQSVFIDNARGTVLSQTGNLDPARTHQAFQAYLSEFNARY